MKKVNFRRVFVVTALASLVLVYSRLWLRMITTPVEYTGADFIAFYTAGRIAQIEGPAHVYNLALQQHYEEQVVGFEVAPEHISPFLHPPFIVPLAQALALDNFILSFVLWDLVMLAFLGLSDVLYLYIHSTSILFEPDALTRAANMLGTHADPNEVVLANERSSQWIAIRNGQLVYLGHLFATMDYQQKRDGDAFYQNDLSVEWLFQSNVACIVYGPHEKDISANFIPPPFAILRYDKDGVRIWQRNVHDWKSSRKYNGKSVSQTQNLRRK